MSTFTYGFLEVTMVQGIATALLQTADTPFSAALRTGQRTFADATGDTVSFSDEAVAKSRARATDETLSAQPGEETGDSLWQTRYDLEAGTVTLKNGHTQKTTIAGNKMEILEYDGNRLVRKERGSIAAGGVVRDIEEYDKRGELTRRIHSELGGADALGATSSSSFLRRDIQWFKDGEVSKELHDSMTVKASYETSDPIHGDFAAVPENLDDLAGTLTFDHIGNDYVGDVIEYNDAGKVFRQTTISQSVRTESVTNRRATPRGDMQGNTTSERSRETKFSVDQVLYDAEGNVSRQVSFLDASDNDASQKQHIEVSSYNKGALVQHSQATVTQERSKGRPLKGRPDMLEALSLSESQFSAETPLDAQELLGDGHGEQVDQAATFISNALAGMSAGDYNPAQGLSRTHAANGPSSVTWENTLYSDGKVTMKQEHSETVTENPHPAEAAFHTVSGLSEDTDAPYVRSSSHRVESYQDGRLVAQSAVEMQEVSEDDARGVTSTTTHVAAAYGSGHAVRNTRAKLSETLIEADAHWNAAAQNAGSAMQMALKDVLALFRENPDPAAASATPART